MNIFWIIFSFTKPEYRDSEIHVCSNWDTVVAKSRQFNNKSELMVALILIRNTLENAETTTGFNDSGVRIIRIDFAIKFSQIDAKPALIGSIIRRCSKLSMAEIVRELRITRQPSLCFVFFIEHFFDLILDLREPW